MAWHIIHSLLEMVRSHSTFPGKLWIILMFVFRILVVARIGDNVYYDEQDQFFCNTQTPGCNQVCFNAFSPISQLRFWSLMVLTVSTPGILFFIYATHKIYHASIKIESQNIQQQQDNDDRPPSNNKLPSNKDLESLGSYLHPPGSKKRKRRVASDTAPTYKECIIKRDDSSLYREIPRSRETPRSEVRRRKRKELYGGGGENAKEFRSFDGTTVKLLPIEDRSSNERPSLPVYEEIVQGRRRGFVKANQTKSNGKGEVPQLKMLENKILYRAYWWHVFFRSVLEGGFLYLQWWLYGFEVSELFVCHRMPCSQPTDCYISRPTEKTVLLYIMFTLGSVSALLSVMEFYTLGWRRFRNSVICCLATEPSNRENISHDKIMLARFNEKRNDDATKKDDVRMNIPHTGLSQYVGGRGMKCDGLSLDSASSNTTIESV